MISKTFELYDLKVLLFRIDSIAQDVPQAKVIEISNSNQTCCISNEDLMYEAMKGFWCEPT